VPIQYRIRDYYWTSAHEGTLHVGSLGQRAADVARGIGRAWLKEIVRQLEQDRPIWENKVQHENPLLCDGDGPIGAFRRWSRQFYTWPEEQSVAE
jgi:bifunctional pyridoxal-dependent enzyme with beta-cystathionase and maltose regulon repressor activities